MLHKLRWFLWLIRETVRNSILIINIDNKSEANPPLSGEREARALLHKSLTSRSLDHVISAGDVYG